MCLVSEGLHTAPRLLQDGRQTASAPVSTSLLSCSFLGCPCCPLASTPCCPHHVPHSLCPFPSAACPGFALPPASMHNSCQALQPSSLKPTGSRSAWQCGQSFISHLHPNFVLTANSSSTTVLSSSCPRFRGVESISRQGGTTQAFIPKVANLGPTGQIQPLSILFGCTMLFES